MSYKLSNSAIDAILSDRDEENVNFLELNYDLEKIKNGDALIRICFATGDGRSFSIPIDVNKSNDYFELVGNRLYYLEDKYGHLLKKSDYNFDDLINKFSIIEKN